MALSYRERTIATTFIALEKQKKRSYNERIQQIERGTFTPLIFGATGGTSRECSIFLSKLAEKISTKQNCKKSDVISGIRRKISFILISSVVTCLRVERRAARSKIEGSLDVNSGVVYLYSFVDILHRLVRLVLLRPGCGIQPLRWRAIVHILLYTLHRNSFVIIM